MKKLLILLLMLCMISAGALAQNEGGFSYSITGGEAKITSYTGDASHLTLPDTLGGCPVTSIGVCAFRGCASLTEVVIPDGVTRIGSNAFQNCSALTQVLIPDSVTRIDTHAFYACASLGQLSLHDNINQIDSLAFYGCSAVRYCNPDSLTAYTLTDVGSTFTSPDYPLLALKAYQDAGQRTFTVADCDETAVAVVLPDGVTSVEGYAFFHCAQLEELVLPEGVTEIGPSAFEGCSALRQITLPDTVKSIAGDAFSGCSGVTVIASAHSPAAAWANQLGMPVVHP